MERAATLVALVGGGLASQSQRVGWRPSACRTALRIAPSISQSCVPHHRRNGSFRRNRPYIPPGADEHLQITLTELDCQGRAGRFCPTVLQSECYFDCCQGYRDRLRRNRLRCALQL